MQSGYSQLLSNFMTGLLFHWILYLCHDVAAIFVSLVTRYKQVDSIFVSVFVLFFTCTYLSLHHVCLRCHQVQVLPNISVLLNILVSQYISVTNHKIT